MSTGWIGRFAPTPSGPLHFGSLVAALASYVIARQKQGQWLLRIEDLDTPREVPGAADQILQTLEAFGFQWDGKVLYQSKRDQAYLEALESLDSQGLLYRCDCSRKQVQLRNQGIYDGFCRKRKLESNDCAVRINFSAADLSFEDRLLGNCRFDSPADRQDFVVRRRDGLYAYQLAVVVDDIYQGINHVVRGADILDSTPRQNFIYQSLGEYPPEYFHLPLVLHPNGEKYSKSKFSPQIKASQASQWLVSALEHLGQTPEAGLAGNTPSQILDWAVQTFSLADIPRRPKIYRDPKTN